jgi:two-component system invasion response regulator UvrY
MTILLIDNQEIILRGIEAVIEKELPTVTCVCFTSLEAGLQFIEKDECTLIIMEINWQFVNARGLVQQILSKKPYVSIIVFTASSEKIYAKWIIQAGAKGFVGKNKSVIELINCVKVVSNGDFYLGSTLLNQLAESLLQKRTPNPFDKLSAREMEICHFLIEGYYVSEIANIMKLHSSTVGTHQHRILKKLGVERVKEIRDLSQLYLSDC